MALNHFVGDIMNNLNKNKEKDNFLLYIPEIKHREFEIQDGKVILYFQHNKLIERFARWLVKKSNNSDITLDDQGSTVWILIDGNRNIYDIAVEMSKKFEDNKDVAIERAVRFLSYLARKGWIKFKVSRTAENSVN